MTPIPTTPLPVGAAATSAPGRSGPPRDERRDPGPADGRDQRAAQASVRRALAPAAVAGPLLCAVLLVAVELTGGRQLALGTWLGQGAALLVAVAVNLLVSRRAGLRLAAAQQQLGQAVHDLTGREAFLAALLESVDTEIVAVTADGQTALINQAARRAYSLSPTHTPAPLHTWTDRLALLAADGATPLGRDQLPLTRALAGEHVHAAEIVLWTAQHTQRRLLVHARPVLLPDGTLAGALSASHDITVLRAEQAEMQRRNRDLDTIAKATLAVLSGADARPAICAAARDATGALAVMLFEPDPTGQTLTARTTCGLDLPELSVPVDHSSLTGRTFQSARAQVIADITSHPGTDQALLSLFRKVRGGGALRSAVFVPVVHHGRTRAVLVVTLDQPLTIEQTRVLALLELLAADAALALSREDLATELAQQAVTDPLTGLANRRRWDTELARETSRAARTGAPLSVLMLDLDHFKAYNDTRGHAAGDLLLRQTGAAWQQLLRTGDLLARVGGEEFAVLLPDCPADAAARLAAGLLRAVPDGQTCSAGAAQYAGDDPEQLLARADAALYRAKSTGRNHVQTAPTPTPTTPASHPPLRVLHGSR